MSITAYPVNPAVDATALLVYLGPANATVSWAITSGAGALEPLAPATDASGRAACRFTPAAAGPVTVSVTHGA
jgi:hypothetical protein